MRRGKKIKYVGEAGAIIPISQFYRDDEEKLLLVDKSVLEGFAFCFLPFKEGDVGMILAEGKNRHSIWYLSSTQEANSRVIGWSLKALERYREWRNWTLIILNDNLS